MVLSLFTGCQNVEKEENREPPQYSQSTKTPNNAGETQDLPSQAITPVPDNVDTAVAQLEQAWGEVNSMRAMYRSTFDRAGTTQIENRGVVLYSNEGNMGKFKYSGRSKGIVDGMDNKEYEGIVLFDGVLMYNMGETLDRSKHAESMLPRLLPTAPPGGQVLFDLLRKDYTISLIPPPDHQNTNRSITLAGHINENPSDGLVFTDIKMTFDASSGRLLKAEGTLLQDGDSWSTEITQPEFNVTMDPAEFVFVCPPDTQLYEGWKNLS